MTNEQLIKKMKEDMKMRNFSKYTYVSGQQKDVLKPSKMRCKIKTSKFRRFLRCQKFMKKKKKESI